MTERRMPRMRKDAAGSGTVPQPTECPNGREPPGIKSDKRSKGSSGPATGGRQSKNRCGRRAGSRRRQASDRCRATGASAAGHATGRHGRRGLRRNPAPRPVQDPMKRRNPPLGKHGRSARLRSLEERRGMRGPARLGKGIHVQGDQKQQHAQARKQRMSEGLQSDGISPQR